MVKQVVNFWILTPKTEIMECGNAMTRYCEDLLNAGTRKCVNVLVEKTYETIQNTIQKDATSIQKAIQKRLEERGITITDLQMKALVFFALNPTATRNDFISSDKRITEGGTISNIGRLQELGLLRREGGKKEGKWVVDIM